MRRSLKTARLRVLVVVVFSLCLLGAAVSASASAAEFGRCLTVEPETGKTIKKGNFTEAACQTVATKLKGGAPVPSYKGAWEWFPGPAPGCEEVKALGLTKGFYLDAECITRDEKNGLPKGKFEVAPGAEFSAETSSLSIGKMVCAHSKAAGEITGATAGFVKVTLTGCFFENNSSDPCTTSGQASGTVVTNTVAVNLLEPTSGTVLTRFVSKSGPTGAIAELTCLVLGFIQEHIKIIGQGAGVTTGDVNVMSATNAVEFGPGIGEQAFQAELSTPHETIAAPLAYSLHFTFEGPTEIKT